MANWTRPDCEEPVPPMTELTKLQRFAERSQLSRIFPIKAELLVAERDIKYAKRSLLFAANPQLLAKSQPK